MVELIQTFGQMGAFQLLLERVQNVQQWCAIEQAHLYTVIIGNMHEMLHRKFAQQFIPLFWESIHNNVLNSPDSNLRNFTSQRITDIVTATGNLLKRVYSLKEKTEVPQ
jgi:hypothetical protein